MELALVFDALGDDVQAEALGQADDGGDQCRTSRIHPDQRVDKRLVDLEDVHREALEVAQRGVTGSEIVNRDADPHVPELRQCQRCPVGVLHEDALGDLEDQLMGIDATEGQGGSHFVGQVR